MTSGLVSDTLTAIEGELKALWAMPDAATQMAKVRASTLNLVVVAAATALEGYRTSTDDLSETHAGRVILLSADGRLPGWEIRHEVSGVCRPSSAGAEPICNDRIELECGVLVGPRIRSVLHALALPEIPVYAEVGPGAPAALADAVVQAADRVIVDSAHTSYRRIRDLSVLADTAVIDRAFIRQHSWRELTARLFDDAVPALRAVRRIEVTSVPREDAPNPGLLVLGWFASRVGLVVGDDGALTDRDQRRVEWAVRAGGAEASPGEVARIAIEAELEGAPLSVTLERAPGRRVVRTTRRGALESEHEHALGHRDEAWVLRKAIDNTASEDVYRAAVAIAARLEAAAA